MAVRHHRDLIAWQLADEFKSEVIRLMKTSPNAWSDLKYRSIDYSLASLGEAEQRLRDGIELGYFKGKDCEAAFLLARRCLTASIRLKQSQRRFNPKRRG